MKKLFAIAAFAISLTACGGDSPTIENECNPADPSFMGTLYKTLNECKDKYIAKLKTENTVLRQDHEEVGRLKLENEKLKHDHEILKVRIHYECKNMEVNNVYDRLP